MRILWGALRAVSVETLGILVVLWMLHGATGLSLDAPWRATKVRASSGQAVDLSSALAARAATAATPTMDEEAPSAAPRTTVRRWFNSLFNASVDRSDNGGQDPVGRETEQRVQYTRERLEHFSRLYGLAARE